MSPTGSDICILGPQLVVLLEGLGSADLQKRYVTKYAMVVSSWFSLLCV